MGEGRACRFRPHWPLGRHRSGPQRSPGYLPPPWSSAQPTGCCPSPPARLMTPTATNTLPAFALSAKSQVPFHHMWALGQRTTPCAGLLLSLTTTFCCLGTAVSSTPATHTPSTHSSLRFCAPGPRPSVLPAADSHGSPLPGDPVFAWKLPDSPQTHLGSGRRREGGAGGGVGAGQQPPVHLQK